MADNVAEQNPDIQFHKAGYLRDQDHVINTFVERIEDIIRPAPSVGLMEVFKNRLGHKLHGR